jgi:hypothetical protein
MTEEMCPSERAFPDGTYGPEDRLYWPVHSRYSWTYGDQERFEELWTPEADKLADDLAEKFAYGWPFMIPKVVVTSLPDLYRALRSSKQNLIPRMTYSSGNTRKPCMSTLPSGGGSRSSGQGETGKVPGRCHARTARVLSTQATWLTGNTRGTDLPGTALCVSLRQAQGQMRVSQGKP